MKKDKINYELNTGEFAIDFISIMVSMVVDVITIVIGMIPYLFPEIFGDKNE